jgi:hypothetical protein
MYYPIGERDNLMTKLVQILMTPVMAFALFVPRPMVDCCKSKAQPTKQTVAVRSCCGSHAPAEPDASKSKGKCPVSGCRDCMASCCVKLVMTLDFDKNAVISVASQSLPQAPRQTPSEQTLRGVFHPPRA